MPIAVRACLSKPALLTAAASAVIAAALLQIPSPARTTAVQAAPAGLAKMRLLRAEHETLAAFLAEQDARQRAAAAIESEPEPEQRAALADTQPEADGQMSSGQLSAAGAPVQRRPTAKKLHLARAALPLPMPILPPPPAAMIPPPAPRMEPPRFAHAYGGWVRGAYRLPQRLWGAAEDLVAQDGPPIPPRPIPRV